MKDFDNIEDWYRDELENFNVEPNKDLWQSLSDELDADMTLTDENFSEWYKREVNKLEERPDYTVWEKLATRLDTASVWDRLVVSLNRYEQWIWWRNTILKGSAILVLLGASYFTYNNYWSTSESEMNQHDIALSPSFIENQNNSESKPSYSSANQKSSSANQTDKSMKMETTTESASVQHSISTAKQNASPTNLPSGEPVLFASLNGSSREQLVSGKRIYSLGNYSDNSREAIEIDRRTITEKDVSHLYSKSDFLVKKEKNKIVFNSKRFSAYSIYGVYARRFFVGLNAGVKKQGLITSIKPNNPIASYSQVEYLDFGSNFGITAGYILSDKINLESNINVISTSGYERRFNGPEDYFKERLDLNYTTVNFMVKKMNTNSTFDNKVYSTNFIGGVYAGFLNASSHTLNNKSEKLETFKNHDFGIVLGIEQDRYISKTFVITPGVRYNQGLINIANNNNAFNNARNFSFEFNLGVKYILLKKSK